MDMEKHRHVSHEEAEAYAASVGANHFNTSAKLNRGIDEMFLDLSKREWGLEHTWADVLAGPCGGNSKCFACVFGCLMCQPNSCSFLALAGMLQAKGKGGGGSGGASSRGSSRRSRRSEIQVVADDDEPGGGDGKKASNCC